jgi:hypothetical protein
VRSATTQLKVQELHLKMRRLPTRHRPEKRTAWHSSTNSTGERLAALKPPTGARVPAATNLLPRNRSRTVRVTRYQEHFYEQRKPCS